jgi:ATP-binding cassette, subfamily A (ABC1), member 3
MDEVRKFMGVCP